MISNLLSIVTAALSASACVAAQSYKEGSPVANACPGNPTGFPCRYTLFQIPDDGRSSKEVCASYKAKCTYGKELGSLNEASCEDPTKAQAGTPRTQVLASCTEKRFVNGEVKFYSYSVIAGRELGLDHIEQVPKAVFDQGCSDDKHGATVPSAPSNTYGPFFCAFRKASGFTIHPFL